MTSGWNGMAGDSEWLSKTSTGSHAYLALSLPSHPQIEFDYDRGKTRSLTQ